MVYRLENCQGGIDFRSDTEYLFFKYVLSVHGVDFVENFTKVDIPFGPSHHVGWYALQTADGDQERHLGVVCGDEGLACFVSRIDNDGVPDREGIGVINFAAKPYSVEGVLDLIMEIDFGR